MRTTEMRHLDMGLSVEISLSENLVQEDDEVPSCSQLEAWAAKACKQEGDHVASIRILDAGEMQALNRDYRHKDAPTNVLSFPMELPAEVEIDLLGDLALCADVINAEASEQKKQRDSHWAHMVVHGMLHLQGYDHIEPSDAEAMESLEVSILGELGFADPYNITN